MTGQDELQIGIIGAGSMGRTHARRYADVGGCLVVAVCDPTTTTAEALADDVAERTGARPKVYADLGSLLAAEKLDAISVCTPPNDHATAAASALERGVAVLCEKPPTRTGAELDTLAARIGPDPMLQFGMCHVFHPGVQQANDLLTSGRLGDVVHLNVRFAHRFDGLQDSWFADPEIAGGGIMLDTLVHSVSIVRVLVGEPRAVSAFTHTAIPGIRVEDSAVVSLQTDSGTVATMQASWATPPGSAMVDIYGTKGQAVIEYGQPALRYRIGTKQQWRHGEQQSETRSAAGDRYHGQAHSFLTAVRSGHVSDNTITDAQAVMRVLDAAYASAQAGGGAVVLGG
ncbi:Gfo/Idh/MocA family oxidoreductase [Phytoactinopolyspora alkaliphila]|uniref:Gfo/Idh/MocA family oxidoreductase n=1 Tax=Phytoactinopolyspora alkaliphila TaxID=1783498 RepID=A0A6N9YS59_9ACTN|nr:Gfo/Idh/MocA family oxidoreductase [Phytoactinopolyspora alkaliphila]NED97873.1 Gfo/Idh/MocA family oxidoreductase [Phytoactinopolyspora alkaliphila]